jgi:hypothetical protein
MLGQVSLNIFFHLNYCAFLFSVQKVVTFDHHIMQMKDFMILLEVHIMLLLKCSTDLTALRQICGALE